MALLFAYHQKEQCYIHFSHGKRGILLQIHGWGLHYKAFFTYSRCNNVDEILIDERKEYSMINTKNIPISH